ncbi:MAG: DUF3006 domain-containing protein [Ruminococcus sp.]|jgi:hypothetical protein|nr:DUF3006 domain-containing protein [Ruminococcus sp.]
MLIIERIYDEFVVVERSDGDEISQIQIPKTLFSGEISEGDVLDFDGSLYSPNPALTAERRALILKKQQERKGKPHVKQSD